MRQPHLAVFPSALEPTDGVVDPTVGDLVLQVVFSGLGFGFLLVIAWHSLQDRALRSEARRCARLQEQMLLLEFFEERWPASAAAAGHPGGDDDDDDDDDDCEGAAGAVEEDEEEEGQRGVAGRPGQGRSSDDDDGQRPLCAICLQPLVLPPTVQSSEAEEHGEVHCEETRALRSGAADAAAGGPRHGRAAVQFACPGSHGFHRRCIRAWVAQGRSTCPVCKFDIRPLAQERFRARSAARELGS
eukprot:CAMPEP_0203936228 /NCGR_PEP_ID=MMETSP0359-20131031/73820_1 /ASSEMBLY_ACC=CAM_ASM_000338 /TAXON_ID=268821 /ORGANISM="Scrippsiella Hangoei, Strain SHTV-5" /LENGTH=243 /DNA_ID=CAMNT_0050866179 /DNA_START=55 /DNA_END=787 /DNA_ORIENTATION=-